MHKSITSSPTPSYASSPDHIAIDMDKLVADQSAKKRSNDMPISSRGSRNASGSAPAAGSPASPPRSAKLTKLQGLLIRGASNELVLEGKRDPKEHALASLDFLKQAILQKAVPGLLEARQAEHDAYMEEVKKLLSTDDMSQPSAMSGKVTRGADGKLKSNDAFVDNVLKFVDAKYPGELDKLHVDGGTKLALPLEAAVLLNARQFEHGCKVRHIDVLDSNEPLPVNINMSNYSARQAIKKAAGGFTEDARLKTDVSELRDRSSSSNEASGSHASAAASGAPDVHPFAFLQGVTYRAESNNPELKQLVEKAFNDPKPAHLWGATLELRGRLGAHAVNTVFNQKEFDWKLGAAMALSVVGSVGIAYGMDVQLVEKEILEKANKKWGPNHPATKFLAVLGPSTVPAPAEVFDSSIVKRVIEKLKGNSILPESRAEFMDDLKDASKSGLIAAAGSILNNAVQLSKSKIAVPFNFATNVLATATSAAMAPIEVAKARDDMAAGVIQQRKDGFFPMPQTESAPATRTEAATALANEVDKDIQGALGVEPGIGQTINSMGIGQVISMAALGTSTGLLRSKLISEMAQKIMIIAANTPTEVLSLGTGILTGNYVGGLDGLLTTDAAKNRAIAALITEKTLQRIQNAADGKGDATVQITEKELHAIEHPPGEVTFPIGKGITDTMNGAIDLFAKMAAAMRGKEATPSLAQKAAETAAHPTLEEV